MKKIVYFCLLSTYASFASENSELEEDLFEIFTKDNEVGKLTSDLNTFKKDPISSTKNNTSPCLHEKNKNLPDVYSQPYCDENIKLFYDLGLKVLEKTDDPYDFLINSYKEIHTLEANGPKDWNSYVSYYWITEVFFQNLEDLEIREHRKENLDLNYNLDRNGISLRDFVKFYHAKFPNTPLFKELPES